MICNDLQRKLFDNFAKKALIALFGLLITPLPVVVQCEEKLYNGRNVLVKANRTF